MKKKQHVLIEHYLIPAVLFMLNICLVHLIYILAIDDRHSMVAYVTTLAIALLALGSALLLKRKSYLIFSIAFYLLLLVGSFSGLLHPPH